jgi:hypothetical protein
MSSDEKSRTMSGRGNVAAFFGELGLICAVQGQKL